MDPSPVPRLYQAPAHEIRIPGEWASKANTYGIRRGGGFFRSRGTTEWESLVRSIAAGGPPLDGPVALCVLVRSATRRKDSHNIQKALLDACESRQREQAAPKGQRRRVLETGQGLYRNDRQVKPLVIFPLPPGDPVTVVGVWPWAEGDVAILSHCMGWITRTMETL